MLLGFNGPLAFAPLLSKLPYDVAKDLAPVIITSSQPNVLAVNAELPARNVRELVALAKASPAKLAYASVGNGSASHLNMELFKAVAQFDEQKRAVNGQYMQASDPGESLRLHGELATVTAQLSEAEERWMQLQEELEALG